MKTHGLVYEKCQILFSLLQVIFFQLSETWQNPQFNQIFAGPRLGKMTKFKPGTGSTVGLYSYPQLTTFESLAVGMLQQRKQKNEGYILENATEAARRPTYIIMNKKEPSKIINHTSTDVTFGGA